MSNSNILDNDKSRQSQIKSWILRKKNLTQISREVLAIPENYPDIIHLNLSYNNFTDLPDCWLQLKSWISWDIRKNSFTDYNALATKLSKFPFWAELKVDFTSSDQVQNLLLQTPQLITINGKNTIDFITILDIEESENNEISIEKMLPLFNAIFSSFVGKIPTENSEIWKTIHAEFQELINTQAKKWNTDNNGELNYIVAKNLFKSQYEVMTFFYTNIFKHEKLWTETDKQAWSGSIWSNWDKTVHGWVDIIETLKYKIDKMANVYRKEVALALSWISDYRNSGWCDNDGMSSTSNFTKKLYQNERDYYWSKIEKLEKDNKAMTDKLIKYSKTIDANSDYLTHIKSYKAEYNKNILNSSQISQSSVLGNQSNNNMNVSCNKNLELGNAKTWTLKAWKDWINEIYQSKINYDKKCIENNWPRETMEQHMYNFLNTKYGWKNIVVEYVSSIILSVRQYAGEDSEVWWFGKILRNEQEEDARLVLEKLKTTVYEWWEYNIKSKYPWKGKGDITKEMNLKTESSWTFEEWNSILSSWHTKDACNEIKNNIISIIKEENEEKKKKYFKNDKKIASMNREQLWKGEKFDEELDISYARFLQTIMEYQIIYRDKYLNNFKNIFRKFDEDTDGIVTEEEFIKLLEHIDIDKYKERKVQMSLLAKIDPNNFKKITFSDLVSFFSKEVVQESSDDISINESKTDRSKSANLYMSLWDKICWEGDE